MIPPRGPQTQQPPQSDADYWEQLKKAGKSSAMATAEVLRRKKESGGASGSWGDKPEPVGMVRGVANAIGQGGTFHFGDEIGGLVDPGGKRRVRADLASFKSAHPVANFIGESAGQVAIALAVPAFRKMGIVGGGAMLGGLDAAGQADNGSIGDRIKAAAVGAGVGAGAGLGIKAGGALGRIAYDVAKPAAKAVANWAKPGVEFATSFLDDRPVGLSTKNVAQVAAARAPQALDNWRQSSRASDLLPRSPGDRASSIMLTALKDDKRTPQGIIDRLMGTQKPRAMADLAGENTGAVQTWARGTPSEARTDIPRALHQRQAGQQERLVNDATELTGTARKNIARSQQDRIATREAESGPLFDQLRQLPPVDGTAFGELLQTPAGQSAIKQAERIALNERRPFPPVFTPDGTVRPLSFEDVQNIKLAMDDMLGGNPSTPLEAGGLGRNNARTIRGLKNAFLDVADQHFDGYQNARDVFGGHAALLKATDDGSRFFQMPANEAELVMEKLSQSERESFVDGAVNALADKIERGMGSFDKTRQVILPTQEQKRLRLLFPDDQTFQSFIGRATEEAEMKHSLNTTVGGSQTFEKFNAANAIEGENADMIGDVATGRFGKAATRLVGRARGMVQKGINKETANELSPMLTAGMGGDRDALNRVLQRLIDAQEREARRMGTRATVSRPFTGLPGGATGGAFSRDR